MLRITDDLHFVMQCCSYISLELQAEKGVTEDWVTFCMLHHRALKRKAVGFPRMLVNFYHLHGVKIPEDSNLHRHHYESNQCSITLF